MDGLSRAAGVGPTVTIYGKTYTVNGFILENWGRIEAEILKNRGNPFDQVRQAADALQAGDGLVNEQLLQQIIERLFQESRDWSTVDFAEQEQFLRYTWPGFSLYCWLAVKHNDHCPDLDQFRVELARAIETSQKDARRAAKAALEAAEPDQRHQMESPDSAAVRGAREFREGLEEAIEQAGGLDERGNSTGSPSSPSGNGAEGEHSTGTPSTETSPTTADGAATKSTG